MALSAVQGAFRAATGWDWDPETLRSRGATIPVYRAMVPARYYRDDDFDAPRPQ